jgi:hypothetical protein
LELRLRDVEGPPAAEVAIAWVRRKLDLVAHSNLGWMDAADADVSVTA